MEELLREERLVLRSLLLPVLGGKLNAKLWTRELEVRGDFKYVVVDGKYVKLRGGRRGILIALGLTDHGMKPRCGSDRGRHEVEKLEEILAGLREV